MKPPVKYDAFLEMWTNDAPWDETQPDRELARIPILHAKYLKIMSYHRMLIKKQEMDYYRLKKLKYEYYKGEFSEEELQEHGYEQFQKRPGRDINLYIDSDKELTDLLLKKSLNEEITDCCERILKELNNRSWQIRSKIDYYKFTQGA